MKEPDGFVCAGVVGTVSGSGGPAPGNSQSRDLTARLMSQGVIGPDDKACPDCSCPIVRGWPLMTYGISRLKWISRRVRSRCRLHGIVPVRAAGGALPPVNVPSEAVMRIAPVLLIVWLVIGAIAGGQRHYYSSSDPNCSRAGTITVTILAGPLNYVGVNPKVACKAPQPSS